MVSASDILFHTGITVSEADAVTYSNLAAQHLALDGADGLPEPIYTEAMCYFIASRISNTKREGQFLSESVSGYSYSRNAESKSGYWYDLYKELISQCKLGSAGSHAYNSGKGCRRVDKNFMHIQRRYRG